MGDRVPEPALASSKHRAAYLARLDADAAIQETRALAGPHDPDPDHSEQVYRAACDLFCCTARLHGLGWEELRILAAAALLHDTGYSVSPRKHHKHSRDIILGMNIRGVDSLTLQMIACVARYHRKALPKDSHRVFRGLDRAHRDVVRCLAGLLRIADGLDRSHCAATRVVRSELTDDTIRLSLSQQFDDPADLVGAMAKRQLFEDVFDVRLELVLEDGRTLEDVSPQR